MGGQTARWKREGEEGKSNEDGRVMGGAGMTERGALRRHVEGTGRTDIRRERQGRKQGFSPLERVEARKGGAAGRKAQPFQGANRNHRE